MIVNKLQDHIALRSRIQRSVNITETDSSKISFFLLVRLCNA